MPTSAPDKPRRSRITAACAVCRGKRQKCSGERPVCDQCRLHNEECWWSETKKRGPAKDYLRSLQDRLQETERLLLALLPRVTDAELLDVLHRHAATSAHAPSHQTWSSAMSGQEHWSHFPLTRLDSIRAWEKARQSYRSTTSTPAAQPEQQQPQSVYDPSLEVEGAAGTRPPYHAPPHDGAVAVAVMPSPSSSTPSAARSAMSAIHHNDPFPATSSAVHTQHDAWPQTEHVTAAARTERRYSEETREAGEALFSISNHTRVAQQQHHQHQQQQQQQHQHQHVVPQPQMQPPSQPWPPSPGREKAGAATHGDPSQTHFPKHLFW